MVGRGCGAGTESVRKSGEGLSKSIVRLLLAFLEFYDRLRVVVFPGREKKKKKTPIHVASLLSKERMVSVKF